MVVDALLEQSVYQQADADQQLVLFITALLRDIAKSETTVIDPVTVKIAQPGHYRRGAIDSRILRWWMAIPFHLREHICHIISVHQLHFYVLAEISEVRNPEFLIDKLSCELPIWMLCAIAKADRQGRIFADKQKVLDDTELYKILAKERGVLYQRRSFADDYTRIQCFRGAHISPDYCFYKH